MSNSFYNASGAPSTSSQLLSSTMRAEFALVASAFDLLPALTGNGSKIIAVNSGATAIEAIATTGTGSGVRATSPTLVTPTLGVASATSINKVTITAPASSATLTIANGKTLTASNTLTLAGTDGSTLNVGAGGTLGSAALLAGAAAVYTPTLTAVSNISASTLIDAYYIRLGPIVAVAVTFSATTSSGGSANTAIDVSFPIASSITSTADVIGDGFWDVNQARATGNAIDDRAQITWEAGDAASSTTSVLFFYRIK